MGYKIIVDKDLEDLIPGFLENRKKDLCLMKQSLVDKEFEQIRIIGHSMKGFGSGYGFDYVSEAGLILEKAAVAGKEETIKITIAKLDEYYADLDIIFE